MLLHAVLLVLAQSDPTLPPLFPAPAAPRHPDGTEIHFLAYKGEDRYAVTVGDQSCETPCTLRLKPGPTTVHLIGFGEGDVQVVIPHLTAQVRVNTGPPSWYLPAGAVMVPVGLVIAATMWMVAFACGNNSGACVALNAVTWPAFGMAIFITGAVLLGLSNRAQPLDANRAEILDARLERPRRIGELAFAFLRDGLRLTF